MNEFKESINMPDHDLLIKVFVIQQEMYKDVKELKDGTTVRLTSLEKEKADKEEVVNHESRISALESIRLEKVKELEVLSEIVHEQGKTLMKMERFMWVFGGVLLAIQFALQFIPKFFFSAQH